MIDVGSQQLPLHLTTCNATYDVTFEVAADQVHVTVTQRRPGQPGAECRDEAMVELVRSRRGRLMTDGVDVPEELTAVPEEQADVSVHSFVARLSSRFLAGSQ